MAGSGKPGPALMLALAALVLLAACAPPPRSGSSPPPRRDDTRDNDHPDRGMRGGPMM